MQCYYCGNHIPMGARGCPACAQPRSKLIYVHLCGVIGGIIGSLIGFTVYDVPGALAGGLLGILIAEFGARWALRPA
jgi:hypothetical protein